MQSNTYRCPYNECPRSRDSFLPTRISISRHVQTHIRNSNLSAIPHSMSSVNFTLCKCGIIHNTYNGHHTCRFTEAQQLKQIELRNRDFQIAQDVHSTLPIFNKSSKLYRCPMLKCTLSIVHSIPTNTIFKQHVQTHVDSHAINSIPSTMIKLGFSLCKCGLIAHTSNAIIHSCPSQTLPTSTARLTIENNEHTTDYSQHTTNSKQFNTQNTKLCTKMNLKSSEFKPAIPNPDDYKYTGDASVSSPPIYHSLSPTALIIPSAMLCPTMQELLQLDLPVLRFIPKRLKGLWRTILVKFLFQLYYHWDHETYIHLCMLPKMLLWKPSHKGKRKYHLFSIIKKQMILWLDDNYLQLWMAAQKHSISIQHAQSRYSNTTNESRTNASALYHVRHANLTTAITTLVSHGIAQPNNDRMNEIIALHPLAQPSIASN